MAHWSILFVDDEPNILSSLRRLMFDQPYDCHYAGSGAEGLELLKSTHVQIVVSDHQMPNMSGSEFLHRVRNYDARIIRCLLSGYTDLITLLEAINRGEVFRFITKPWEEEILLRTIRECIAEYQTQLGTAILQKAMHVAAVPFAVGLPAQGAFTWMNQAARDLLLQPGAALPDYDNIGTGPDAMPWLLKDLVPGAGTDIEAFLTRREHVWRGEAGAFRPVKPKGFADSDYAAWLWFAAGS